MEYLTVHEAAAKWNVNNRWIQQLCADSRITGAVRFGNKWAIPADSYAPQCLRRKHGSAAAGGLRSEKQGASLNHTFFKKIVELFPNAVQVCDSTGAMVYCNKAFINMFHITDEAAIVGKYNLWEDPFIEQCGLKHDVEQLRQGKPVEFSNIKVPLQAVVDTFQKKILPSESVYLNISSVPFSENSDSLSHILTVFSLSRRYDGNTELIKSQEYMEAHWKEDYNSDALARVSGLSMTQLIRLFKQHTGLTPHKYFVNIKLSKLQEKLLDNNLSITQAFTECGIDYSGYYAKVFREEVGMTPMEYRKEHR